MSTSVGATAPVFSYAQAAKGLTPTTSTQNTSRNESPAASEKSTKDRAAPDVTGQAVGKSPKSKLEPDEKHLVESVSPKSSANTPSKETGDRDKTVSTQQVQPNPEEEQHTNLNGGSSDSYMNRSAQTDEARTSLLNGNANSAEQSQDSSARDKSAHSASDKKSKDVDDDWEKVSVPSVAAEKELKAAPIPTVNIWKQRQEAQAAKLKDIQDQQRSATSNSQAQTVKPKNIGEEPKRKPTSRDQGSSERDGKPTDVPRGGARRDALPARSSRPASQQDEKVDSEAPPAVGDTRSWPTPENSNVDERRKSTSYEKVDKPDSKLVVQKSHGKSWVPVPFVPSAKFETQLPPSAARRGGRGGNRGRESGGRGGHSAGTPEKQEAPGLMGPPPVPKQGSEQDRGRRFEGHRGARGASVPGSSTRPTSGDDGTTAFSKQTTSFGKEPTANDVVIPSASAKQNGDEHDKTEQSSRSSSRHTGRASTRVLNGDGQGDSNPGGFANSNDQNSRPSYSFDRFKGPGNATSRGNGDFSKDRGSGRNRDWSRDKPDSARDKVESWRDRDTSGDQNGRREPRGERGRGSGYRGGRGNHSYSTPYPSSHAYTSPLPQNGFEPSRSSSNNETRSRQTSQPFQPTQPSSSARANPRSQSIPVQLYPGYYNGLTGPNVGHGLPFLQTDITYPPMQMQPGIMTAVPFNDPLNSFALMSMVITQIEYYFSIDNLCKDVFLRKHMDSQGWVPLSVIANFKRIKTLTEDNMTLDNLRYVCQTVKSIEFLPGLDGEDRLRRRDNWRDFVLPPEERFESARHDGPAQNPDQFSRASVLEQTPSAESGFALGQVRSPPISAAPTNGLYHASSPMSYVAGAPTDPQLLNGAFVSPFNDQPAEIAQRPPLASTNSQASTTIRSPPPQASTQPTGFVNGHHRHSSRSDIEANSFPDENIPNINIRMQPRTFVPASEIQVQPNATHGPSNDSPDAPQDSSNAEPTRVLSLRGGAGSPQQLEQLRNISFGFANGVPIIDESSVIYFTKDGQETHLPPPRPGQYDQTYLALHDVAFQQKQLGVDGALEPLYSFWTDFLVDKFNFGMYQEFKAAALNEAQEGNTAGMTHLIRYFTKVLGGAVPVSERLASDMVTLAREEEEGDRPLFHTLRAVWRNGATNMKTIKRLGDHFTAEEKAELDKSG